LGLSFVLAACGLPLAGLSSGQDELARGLVLSGPELDEVDAGTD
jgi:hypothetical protein